MTFTEIVHYVADRYNLKSDDQLARVGTSVNMRHREILSSLGVSQVTQRTVATATTVIGSRYLTFGPSPVAVIKIIAVYNLTAGTYPPPLLKEVTPDQLLAMGVISDPASAFAISTMGERTVTIEMNSSPATNYVLTADVEGNVTQLSGALSPAFSEDYHDILVNMVMADELEKAEKYDKATAKLKQADKRMGELRLFIAKSAYKDMVQGSRSGSVMASGGGSVSSGGGLPVGAAGTVLAGGTIPVFTATPTVTSIAVALLRTSGGAVPTVASGGGTTPSVVAGSSPLAGTVNVGTGGVATSIVIAFNTTFPAVPHVTLGISAGSVPTTYTVTTTQLTLSTSVAWPASTLVSWHAISA